MYRLIYVSRARQDLSDEDIGDILDVSTNNNHERYLTGFLVQNHSLFMQVLEGDEEEVHQTYSRICTDDRHSCVMQIVGERIRKRAFPDWAMNYHRVDGPAGSPPMVVRRNEPVGTLMPASAPRDLLGLFSRFITVC